MWPDHFFPLCVGRGNFFPFHTQKKIKWSGHVRLVLILYSTIEIVGEEVLRRRAKLEKIGPDRIAGGQEKINFHLFLLLIIITKSSFLSLTSDLQFCLKVITLYFYD